MKPRVPFSVWPGGIWTTGSHSHSRRNQAWAWASVSWGPYNLSEGPPDSQPPAQRRHVGLPSARLGEAPSPQMSPPVLHHSHLLLGPSPHSLVWGHSFLSSEGAKSLPPWALSPGGAPAGKFLPGLCYLLNLSPKEKLSTVS